MRKEKTRAWKQNQADQAKESAKESQPLNLRPSADMASAIGKDGSWCPFFEWFCELPVLLDFWTCSSAGLELCGDCFVVGSWHTHI